MAPNTGGISPGTGKAAHPYSIATTAPTTQTTPTSASSNGAAPVATSTAGTAPEAKATGGATPGRSSAASGTGKLSAGAILAAVIGGLLVLACLVWAAFRWTAVEPRWTLPLRHSMAEAGFRASAVWAEFTDWIRLGH